jgi:hypothetical protein
MLVRLTSNARFALNETPYLSQVYVDSQLSEAS